MSDLEEHNDLMESDEEAFEPAGEVEVLDSENDDGDEEDESSSQNFREPAAKRKPCAKWRKRADLDIDLPAQDCSPVLLEYPELVEDTEFDTWRRFARLAF